MSNDMIPPYSDLAEIAGAEEWPNTIVPFSTTRETFIRAIAEAFVTEDYAPNDIFRNTNFSEVKPSYLPMFIFQVDFEGVWNCEIGIDNTFKETYYENGNSYTRTKTITVWGPASGLLSGTVYVNTPACTVGSLPVGLGEFVEAYPISSGEPEAFSLDKFRSGDYSPGYSSYNIYRLNISRQEAWNGCGRERAKIKIDEKARTFEPSGKTRNFRTEYKTEKSSTILVFTPYWYVGFQYRDVKCYAIMDGVGSNLRVCIPIDQARVREVKRNYRNSLIALVVLIIVFIASVFILNAPALASIHELANVLTGIAFFTWGGLLIWAIIAEKVIISSARKIREAHLRKLEK